MLNNIFLPKICFNKLYFLSLTALNEKFNRNDIQSLTRKKGIVAGYPKSPGLINITRFILSVQGSHYRPFKSGLGCRYHLLCLSRGE